jgi:hypothetical protein
LKNPIKIFDIPIELEDWFPPKTTQIKREQISKIIYEMEKQQNTKKDNNNVAKKVEKE